VRRDRRVAAYRGRGGRRDGRLGSGRSRSRSLVGDMMPGGFANRLERWISWGFSSRLQNGLKSATVRLNLILPLDDPTFKWVAAFLQTEVARRQCALFSQIA